MGLAMGSAATRGLPRLCSGRLENHGLGRLINPKGGILASVEGPRDPFRGATATAALGDGAARL